MDDITDKDYIHQVYTLNGIISNITEKYINDASSHENDIIADMHTILKTHKDMMEKNKIIMDKYKNKCNILKFKLDTYEIHKTIQKQEWYINSSNKKLIDWLINQLHIKSYQKSDTTGNFKIVAKFIISKVMVVGTYNDNVYDISICNIDNPTKTCNLSKIFDIVTLFDIDKSRDINVVKTMGYDIINIIEQIILYYTPIV